MNYLEKWFENLEGCNCSQSISTYETPAKIIRYPEDEEEEKTEKKKSEIAEGTTDRIDKKIHGKKDYWERRIEYINNLIDDIKVQIRKCRDIDDPKKSRDCVDKWRKEMIRARESLDKAQTSLRKVD